MSAPWSSSPAGRAHAKRYNRERYLKLRAARRAWLAEHGPCAECKSWENLEVDHVDRLQKRCDPFSLTGSAARRAAELVKCQALCAVCHREKSLADMGGPPADYLGAKRKYSVGWNAQMRAEQRRLGLLSYPQHGGAT